MVFTTDHPFELLDERKLVRSAEKSRRSTRGEDFEQRDCLADLQANHERLQEMLQHLQDTVGPMTDLQRNDTQNNHSFLEVEFRV